MAAGVELPPNEVADQGQPRCYQLQDRDRCPETGGRFARTDGAIHNRPQCHQLQCRDQRYGKQKAGSDSWRWACLQICDRTQSNPDVISYRSAIRACRKDRRRELALHFPGAIQQRTLDANVIGNNSSISAGKKGRQWLPTLYSLGKM